MKKHFIAAALIAIAVPAFASSAHAQAGGLPTTPPPVPQQGDTTVRPATPGQQPVTGESRTQTRPTLTDRGSDRPADVEAPARPGATVQTSPPGAPTTGQQVPPAQQTPPTQTR